MTLECFLTCDSCGDCVFLEVGLTIVFRPVNHAQQFLFGSTSYPSYAIADAAQSTHFFSLSFTAYLK